MNFSWRRPFVLLAVLALCAAAAGCGPSLVKVKGKVLRDGGSPLKGGPEATGVSLTVLFSPIVEGGQAENSYPARFLDPVEGSFEVPGKTGKGIPPGKYRVVVMLLSGGANPKDLLDGAFSGRKGKPFIREVSVQSPEVTVDLAKPEG